MSNPSEWSRRCRIEAARAIHPMTKDFLLELARELEIMSGETANVDPDDMDLQTAIADRLSEVAKRKDWTGRGN